MSRPWKVGLGTCITLPSPNSKGKIIERGWKTLPPPIYIKNYSPIGLGLKLESQNMRRLKEPDGLKYEKTQRAWLKIWRDSKSLVQNMRRLIEPGSKYEEIQRALFKIWGDSKSLVQNMRRLIEPGSKYEETQRTWFKIWGDS